MEKIPRKSIAKISFDLFTSLILTSVYTIIIASVFGLGNNAILNFLAGVVNLALYIILCFTPTYDAGTGDRALQLSGHNIKTDMSRGFKAGLIGTLPNFILGTAVYLALTNTVNFIPEYISGILNSVFLFLNMPLYLFHGLLQNSPMYYVIFPLIMPLAAAISYALGFHRKAPAKPRR